MTTDRMNASGHDLLEVLLESWDRNNAVLLGLLGALPAGGLQARALEGSPTVAEMFTHIHYVRLAFVSENAPECAAQVPMTEWLAERDASVIARQLTESAAVVRRAVESRVKAGRGLDQSYSHPFLFVQHLVWHEGYHHGQIKLALKAIGRPLSDRDAGPVTWGHWRRKNPS